MEWNGINILCKLPRLEVLKLLSNACVGKEWELPEDDDKFCQLIVLEIHSTDLKDWKATGDHFPKLKHLSLSSCKKLKEIPRGFAEIEELKSIQLAGCRPSVVASAQEIKEEQLDYLNNIVDVVVAEQRKLWELPEDDKFCELIVLEISKTDLEDWKVTGHHFPKLEHISLSSCKKLKEIPSGLAEISRLKSIQLRGCCPSVLASAQEIKEEQLDYLNNIVDVVVAEQHGYSPVSEPCLMKGSFMKMSFFRRAGGKLE
nr:putative late blight resistance protein homolog R1A-10 [Ipomoea trifida]